MSSVLEKIEELLNKAKVEYKRIDHEPVYTSEQAAKIRDSDIRMGAKAIVCYADNNPVLIVVPGDKKINFGKFKRLFGVKDLKMAQPSEVIDITTLEVGAIPPVGKSMNLQSYYDKSFQQKDKVAFNAGSHTTSIIMKARDLIEVEKPKFGDFAEDR